MTDRNRRVAIILTVVCGAGLLVCVVCGAVGAFRMQQWGQQMAADAEMTMREAQEFGQSHDQIACRDEGLRRTSVCGPTDIGCQTQAGVFTETCLGLATPTPGLCDGVPAPTEIMASATWATPQCAQLGRQGDQRCTSLMQSVQRACQRQ